MSALAQALLEELEEHPHPRRTRHTAKAFGWQTPSFYRLGTMAVDQTHLRDRIDAGCKLRIVPSGRCFLIVLNGPAPAGVVCVGDKRKEFPSREHASDWLANLGLGNGARKEGGGQSLPD